MKNYEIRIQRVKNGFVVRLPGDNVPGLDDCYVFQQLGAVACDGKTLLEFIVDHFSDTETGNDQNGQ